MSRIELTNNALRHGQVVLAGGVQYRVEWGLNNRLYLVRASDNVLIARARSQGELRHKIAQLERAA